MKTEFYQDQIVLTFGITQKMRVDELQELGTEIACHVLDTFNDNQSIHSCVGVKTQRAKVKQ